jgi:hypothetical protein
MVRSKATVKDLTKNYNIVPNKTHTLIPPNISEENISHFVRGFFDGDGSIGSGNYPRTHIVSSSKDILDWILKWYSKYSDTSANVRKRKNKNFYELEFGGKYAIKFLKLIYKDAAFESRLERKFKLYSKLIGV